MHRLLALRVVSRLDDVVHQYVFVIGCSNLLNKLLLYGF